MPKPSDLAQSDPFGEVLREYLGIPGMNAAILISDQGLMISSAAREGVDAASIAALIVETLAAAQGFGAQIQAGGLDTMSIEYEKLTVVLAPFAPDVVLALVAAPGSLRGLTELRSA